MTEVAEFALEGVYNFRDFGGVAVEGGGRVRRGRLFRSAHFARATEADLDQIDALGVKLVVDLRRVGERKTEPSRWRPGASPRILASEHPDPETLPPHIRFLRDSEHVEAQAVRGYMLETYARMPFEPRHVETFARAFTALAEGEAPAVVHCAAGKDRTGVFCALVLDALGADDAAIDADYLRTNDAVNLDGILAQASVRFTRLVERPIDPEALRPMVGVDLGYLNAARTAIAERAGPTSAYLTDVLGLTASQLDALRAHFIEA